VAPAIVDEILFNAAADRLRRNKLESRRRLSEEEAEQFLLRNYIRCGHCDAPMRVFRGRLRTRRDGRAD
jgi:hypothetical protein